MSVNLKEAILYFFVPVWIAAETLIMIWMFKAKPDKNIKGKYPRKVVMLSQLPFGKSWANNIDKDDVKVLQTYQRRIRVWYLSLMIPFFLIMYVFTL
jgi:hypothetical protein